MLAVVCRELSGLDGLSVEELPAPEPEGPGQVRIRVRAAGLNFADSLIIKGQYQERPDLPFVPGMEIAGTVEACGEGVASLSPGERVSRPWSTAASPRRRSRLWTMSCACRTRSTTSARPACRSPTARPMARSAGQAACRPPRR